ncbi:hypothetical protein [Bacillus cereus group sp. BfR-BA-01315]|uniref:hypothetical protein n=1 Tax=Bacillus cereus group sp. BfR-BA-01315 TaxID=2920292 RepID=UPI001F59DC49|nr:hypothetical protein [Bacillus cereus group sp. BfR-BA-01315]
MKYKPVPTWEQYKIAEKNGISKRAVDQRVKNGSMTVEEAITKPLYKEFKTKYQKYIELAKRNGISYSAFYKRIKTNKCKLTPEEAATIPPKEKRNKLSSIISEENYEKAAGIGVSRKYVNQRIEQYGWSIERAINTPVGTSWEGKEKYKNMYLLAEKHNISRSTFFRRLDNGMTPYQAATLPKGFGEVIKIAQEHGIKDKTFYQRVKRGMDPYEAATKPVKKYTKEQIS